jgi:hypothetical protein
MKDAVAGYLILAKDQYEFKLSGVHSFKRDSQNADGSPKTVFGINVNLDIVSGPEHVGKTQRYQLYLHTDKAWGPAKQFVMAAYGFTNDQSGEAAFNEQYGDGDWSFDYDDGSVGDLWKGLEGKTIKANVDTQPNKIRAGEVQQTYRWLPA